MQTRGHYSAYIARQVGGEEYDKAWSIACENYPGYEKYKARVERIIPIMILDPVSVE